jgi:hypothetical protein
MENAFCRKAPSVRFRSFAIFATGNFSREYCFSVRRSLFVHSLRRVRFTFLAIMFPLIACVRGIMHKLYASSTISPDVQVARIECAIFGPRMILERQDAIMLAASSSSDRGHRSSARA